MNNLGAVRINMQWQRWKSTMYCLSNIHLSCSSVPSHRNGEFPPSQNIISFMTQHDCCIAATRSFYLLLFSQGSKTWRETQSCCTEALLLELSTEIKFWYYGINFKFADKKRAETCIFFRHTIRVTILSEA